MVSSTLIVLVVIAALVFTFTNGFHDTANAIATVVSTGVMRPRTAVMMAAVLNLIGAFMGTAVARTISKDLVDPLVATQVVVLAALFGAIAWNLLTWYFGFPSSSSHALLGGLVGAAWASGGPESVLWEGVNKKVVFPLMLSPLMGFFAAFIAMVGVTWAVRRMRPPLINSVFRKLQLVSAGFMALSHGTNDAQKSVGVVTLALLAGQPATDARAPTSVIVACALAMGAGTAMGGWGIIKTMGSKIFKLRSIHGFVAETTAATVIKAGTIFGLPTSTTHCITSSIMGAGATTRLSAVSWGVTRRILVAWVLTFPGSAAVAAGSFYLLDASGI